MSSIAFLQIKKGFSSFPDVFLTEKFQHGIISLGYLQ